MNMRMIALVMAVALVAGLAFAAGAKAPAKAAGTTHNMTVQVVSFDVTAKTITIKDDKGETKTAPVMGKAIGELKTVKAGDMVMLTCKDNAKGEHQGIIAIKAAKPAAK
ncbi:MAG: hypothetical protein LAO51_18820 [Acidobacteriia bacterium]|nr:hypothetical protein [Terriglobia bacterium]